MTTLHIEHAITDYTTWKAAFDRFAPARTQAGVRAHRILRPVDDPAYVVIELDFASEQEAAAFLGFLRAKVWGTPGNAPALVGAPRASILKTPDALETLEAFDIGTTAHQSWPGSAPNPPTGAQL